MVGFGEGCVEVCRVQTLSLGWMEPDECLDVGD